jgi:tRNA threonylcarbamoyl adenosine modification protein YeaZ
MSGRVILAIDTALQAASACVFEEEADAPLAAETLNMDRGHAEALLPLVGRVMARLEGGFPMLSRVAVTVGPGSFTGLRVGIAAARAIGLACEIPVVGVSTLAALAAPAILEHNTGLVVAAIDARHANIYFAAFGGDGRAVLQPRLASLRDAVRALGAGPVRLVGPAAPMLAIEASAAGLSVEITGALVAPDISFVAKLGLLADPRTAPARPLYLKAPDAKPQDANRVPLAPV